MNLALTESQELLRRNARDFLTEASPPSLVKAMMADETGFSQELWRGMVDQGWTGLVIPEQYGGSGGEIVDAVILFQEIGRALAPSPLFSSSILGALVLIHAGSEEQKQALLPEIAEGRRIVTLAFTEPSATWEPEGIAATLDREGDGYVLSGTKLFVPDAHISNPLIVAARSGGAIRLVLVDPESSGVSLTALSTIAGDKQFEVRLDGVHVPESALLPGGLAELDAALLRATIIKCAEMEGSSRKALEMAVEYSKQRIAFGRPIGAFQAIQHKCAVMVTNIDALQVLIYEAAWKIDEGLPADIDVSMVKDYANEVYRDTTTEAHLIFAGLAYTMDHDLHLHFRRVKPSEAMLGDSRFHQEKLAKLLAL